MATDEQIELLTELGLGVMRKQCREALAAVLAENAALRTENGPLRKLADAVEEHDEAAKHDRLKESGFARHNAARRALDAALAEARKP